MEALMIGAFMLKYDTIESTFRNLEPFLNVERNFEYLYYQMIVILKTLYVLYAMENSIPKLWTVIFTACSTYCFIYVKPVLAVSAYFALCLHFFGVYFLQMAFMGTLSLSNKSYEFLLDVNVLLCTLYYATQTYKREMDKLVIIICFSLSLGSYINNIESAEPFKSGVYYLLVLLCLATLFPLLPDRKQYGHRLMFYYMVLIVWVVYKGELHRISYGLSSNVSICNSTEHSYQLQECNLNDTLESRENVTRERLHIDGNLTYSNLKSDLQFKNLAEDLKNCRMSSANKSEGMCQHDLNPNMTCPVGVDNEVQMCSLNKKEATREYDLNPNVTHSAKVDSTEQEKSNAEIKEMANEDAERMEAAEEGKELLAEMQENLKTSGDESDLLEKDHTNVKQEQFADGVHNRGNSPLEDEMYSNTFEMETDGSSNHRDEKDAVEKFPATETSVDDIDYKIEKRMGSAQRIEDGINFELVYKAPEVTKTSDQQRQNEKFVIGAQTFDATKSGENFIKVLTYDHPNTNGSEMAKLKVAGISEGVENMPKGNEAEEVVDLSQLTDCNNEQRFNMTELQEAQTCEEKETVPKPFEVIEKDFTNINNVKKSTKVDLQVKDFKYKSPRSFIMSVPVHSKGGDAKVSELQTTVATGPEEEGMYDIEMKDSQNAEISLKEFADNQEAEYKAKESELFETNAVKENAKTAGASFSISNPNEIDEIRNKWTLLKENSNKVALSEHAKPAASTETKTCDQDLASRERDYETCKLIESPPDNHEIFEVTKSSEVEHKNIKIIKNKIINLHPSEDADKTNELKSETVNFSSNDLPFGSLGKVEDAELNKYNVNAILGSETTEYESTVFDDSEKASLETIQSSYTSTRETHYPEKNNLQSYFNEDSTTGVKTAEYSKTKRTEAEMFKVAETKKAEESDSLKADMPKFTSASNPRKTELQPAKENEAESIDSDTRKSHENNPKKSIESKDATSETVSSKYQPASPESNQSTETEVYTSATKVFASKVNLSRAIESKSNQDEENDSVNSKSGEGHSGTMELQASDNSNNKKEVDISKVTSPNENELKSTKSRLTADASEFIGTEENVPLTIESKLITEREVNIIPNENDIDHLRTAKLEPIKATASNTKETKIIRVVGSEKGCFNRVDIEDTSTETTEPQVTKNMLFTTDTKQNEVEVVDFTEREHENKVSRHRTEKLETLKVSYPNTRETMKPIQVLGPENSLKSTEARKNDLVYKGDTELGATKKDVSREIEQKQTQQAEVNDSVASGPNEVRTPRTKELDTTVSYFDATEMKLVKVTDPEESQFKTTKSYVEIDSPKPIIGRENNHTN